MRSQTPGQTAGARPLPQPGGGAAPGTQPLPTPPRAAEPGTRGSLSLGLPSSRQGLATSPFAPEPPTPEKAMRPGAERQAPGASFIFGSRHQRGVAFSSNRPPTTSSCPQPLYLAPLPRRQTDKRHKEKREGGETNYRPSCSHPPARSREEEEEGEDVFPPPLHPDSATRADLAARSPGVAEREEVRLEEAETRRQ